jgi:hypothetical protein
VWRSARQAWLGSWRCVWRIAPCCARRPRGHGEGRRHRAAAGGAFRQTVAPRSAAAAGRRPDTRSVRQEDQAQDKRGPGLSSSQPVCPRRLEPCDSPTLPASPACRPRDKQHPTGSNLLPVVSVQRRTRGACSTASASDALLGPCFIRCAAPSTFGCASHDSLQAQAYLVPMTCTAMVRFFGAPSGPTGPSASTCGAQHST